MSESPTPEQAIDWRMEDILQLHAVNNKPSGSLVEVIRNGRLVASLFPGAEIDSERAAMRMAPLFGADVVIVVLDIDLDNDALDADRALTFTALDREGGKASALVPYRLDAGEYVEVLRGVNLSSTFENWIHEGFRQYADMRPAIEGMRKALMGDEGFAARVHEDCAIAKILLDAGVVIALLSEEGSEEIIAESFADEDTNVIFNYQKPDLGFSMN